MTRWKSPLWGCSRVQAAIQTPCSASQWGTAGNKFSILSISIYSVIYHPIERYSIDHHLPMIHAVTLRTRTGSVVRCVNPFYIWHAAPGTVICDWVNVPTFDWEAVAQCCSCIVGTHPPFFQNHIAEGGRRCHIKDSQIFFVNWFYLTLRKDLNLLISGLQFPEPPWRKWIRVDLGSEGRGL